MISRTPALRRDKFQPRNVYATQLNEFAARIYEVIPGNM
jgi:hypothetical protein